MFELTVLLLVFTFEKVKQNSSRLLPNSNGHFVSLKPNLIPLSVKKEISNWIIINECPHRLIGLYC